MRIPAGAYIILGMLCGFLIGEFATIVFKWLSVILQALGS